MVRARKVGTTRTKVDSVVYRLLYPVLLFGIFIFSLCHEEDFLSFFCLIETWTLILQIFYAIIFLSNVLDNNLYREDVRHRQKIPETIVVTDTVVKGGQRLFICKRYSILPTNYLNVAEGTVWLLFNVLATINAIRFAGLILNKIHIYYTHRVDLEKTRVCAMFALIVADIILTPIPVNFLHVVYPLVYYAGYSLFLNQLFRMRQTKLYENDGRKGWRFYLVRFLLLSLAHLCVYMVARFRDYIISKLDDSQTPEKIHDLRTQKRLMRRRLMNYVEGPDGRIVEITLEKQCLEGKRDEVIMRDKNTKNSRKRTLSEVPVWGRPEAESTDVETIKAVRGGRWGETSVEEELSDSIPISVPVKPPPQERYMATPKKDRFSSSSSEEMESVKKHISRLPKAPGTSHHRLHHHGREKSYHSVHLSHNLHTENQLEDSELELDEKLRFLALGRTYRARNSISYISSRKENNQPEGSKESEGDPESPPTPPLFKMVQAAMDKQKDYERWQTKFRK